MFIELKTKVSLLLRVKILIAIWIGILSYLCLKAQESPFENMVSDSFSENSFPIVSSGKVSAIYYDINEFKGVVRAINDLQRDVKLVTGLSLQLSTTTTYQSLPIIVGTIGKSDCIDRLIKSRKNRIATTAL